MADDDEADDLETPVLRPLVWLGNSRRNIRAFPAEAQKIIGDELQLIQLAVRRRMRNHLKASAAALLSLLSAMPPARIVW